MTIKDLFRRRGKKKKKLKHTHGPVARARIRHNVRAITKDIKRKKAKLAENAVEKFALGKVQRYIDEIHRCVGLGQGYKWGGGHGESPTHAFDSPHSGGGDCSSYACHLDQTAVEGVETGSTFQMVDDLGQNGLEDGPGEFVTHHITNDPPGEAHVITSVHFRGRTIWTECGGSDNTEHGGPCIFSPSPERIHHFPIKVHPRGL